MAKETLCPECGSLMTGYNDGDICYECDSINDVANEVLHHIDIMYPKMWKAVARTARTSIRNTIKSKVREYML